MLTESGKKVAYARYDYEETGIKDADAEIVRLAQEGYSHIFVDEATYLGGFVNAIAEWADTFVPLYRLKIIISGTDGLMLASAQSTSLFHRYVQFSTNWCSYPEYKRITGNSFEQYRRFGGVFEIADYQRFIQDAVVENLIHAIEHLMDGPHRRTILIDRLYAIEPAVAYKAVIGILKCAVEISVKEHFAEKASEKNIPDIGAALANISAKDKRDIKERVAESGTVYRKFTGASDPLGTIEALIEFLLRIGCLDEYTLGVNEFVKPNTLTFCHNALMNFAVEETIQSIAEPLGSDFIEIADGIKQASMGAMNESIVFAHFVHSIMPGKSIFEGDKIFKYHDSKDREIDAVIINRDAKKVFLIEVKSKSTIKGKYAFLDEAKHMFDSEVLKNIGIDETFLVTRIIAYSGESLLLTFEGDELFLVNTEQLIARIADMNVLLTEICRDDRLDLSQHSSTRPKLGDTNN
jgi:hypothetical protein